MASPGPSAGYAARGFDDPERRLPSVVGGRNGPKPSLSDAVSAAPLDRSPAPFIHAATRKIRSRHRAQHLRPRGRAHQRAPGQADADPESPLGGCRGLRPAARPRLCRSPGRSRPAHGGDPAGALLLQRRDRAGPARLRRRRAPPRHSAPQAPRRLAAIPGNAGAEELRGGVVDARGASGLSGRVSSARLRRTSHVASRPFAHSLARVRRIVAHLQDFTL
jgi:hypothetical protein